MAHALRRLDRTVDEDARLAAALDGDADAREWLARRWAPPLYRFTYRMTGNEQDARDAAQDTLVKALRHLDAYDSRRRFSTWLFSIARNTCIDQHRKRKRRSYEPPGDVADPTPGPLHLLDRKERAEQLHEALAKLPPMYREILVLYHFEHLKYAEIAETLDLPMGTVMNRIFRARKKLRAIYDAHTEAAP